MFSIARLTRFAVGFLDIGLQRAKVMKTLRKQISANGMGKSMSLQEDSRASLFHQSEREEEKMMTVISGRRCYELYMKYGHVGSFVKTLLESLRCYSPGLGLKWEAKTIYSERITYYVQNKDTRLTKYARILRTKDIPSRRLLFQLVPSVRRIDGIGYGLLQGKLLPTPTASCCKTGTTKHMRSGKSRDSQLNHLISRKCGKNSRLNPLFVEEMMGFPKGWMVSPFLNG